MGNYSTLWITPNIDSELNDNDIYHEVKCSIPLFWLTLFNKEDIHMSLDEDGEQYPVFRTTILNSIANFQSKFGLWSIIFHDENINELARKFISFLEQYPTWTIELNINDITAMDNVEYNYANLKNEMIKITQSLDSILSMPHAKIPKNSWLPRNTKLLTTQDRILYLDGFGSEFISYPELDETLKKNDQQVVRSKKFKKQIYITIFILMLIAIIFCYLI